MEKWFFVDSRDIAELEPGALMDTREILSLKLTAVTKSAKQILFAGVLTIGRKTFKVISACSMPAYL